MGQARAWSTRGPEWISMQGPGSHSSVLGPSRHSPLAPTRLVKVDFGPSAYNLVFILLRIFHACTRILAFRIWRWGQRGAKLQNSMGSGAYEHQTFISHSSEDWDVQDQGAHRLGVG